MDKSDSRYIAELERLIKQAIELGHTAIEQALKNLLAKKNPPGRKRRDG